MSDTPEVKLAGLTLPGFVTDPAFGAAILTVLHLVDQGILKIAKPWTIAFKVADEVEKVTGGSVPPASP